MTDETIPAPGQTPIVPSPEEPVHDIGPPAQALIAGGLLWALNEFVCHGRGYEVVMMSNGNLGIKGNGGSYRAWQIDPDAINAAMRKFRQSLLDAQGANKRAQQDGHSPGFRTVGSPTN